MHRFFVLLPLVLLASCGPPKQAVPVSTNPLGATVWVDGKRACTTPCSVRLAKDGEHLLTIVKEGYEQVDLEVTRRFRPDKPLRDAAIGAILRGGDAEEVAGRMAYEVDQQEKSGEAYVLEPSMVRLTLEPMRGE